MDAVSQNASVIAQAFCLTIQLFLISGAGALVIGTILAAMRVSPIPPLRWTGATYVRIFRNTPLTLILLICFFGLPQVGIVIDFYPAALLGLTIYTASFVCEAVRSGINAVP